MQLRRDFHQQNKFQVAHKLRTTEDAYRAADNTPGDLDERPDRVTLQTQEGLVQAVLSEGGFAERLQATDGKVTLSQFEVPRWYDPISRAGGAEYQKQGETLEGRSLDYKIGWTSSYHQHGELKPEAAQSGFAELEGLFA
ncbi:MAG: hypothetical protein WC314_16865 [Vulcanimicrobiota bacterium]